MRAKIRVPYEHFHEVNRALTASGVKFYPFRSFGAVYHMEFEPADHPLVTFLLLKYDDLTIMP